MSIALNKLAKERLLRAIRKTETEREQLQRTPLMLYYRISKRWRDMADTPDIPHRTLSRTNGGGTWNARDVAAARLVLTAIDYLQSRGCTDIEALLRETDDYEAITER